jgi:hypothetical protein
MAKKSSKQMGHEIVAAGSTGPWHVKYRVGGDEKDGGQFHTAEAAMACAVNLSLAGHHAFVMDATGAVMFNSKEEKRAD